MKGTARIIFYPQGPLPFILLSFVVVCICKVSSEDVKWSPNIEIIEILSSQDNQTEVIKHLNKPKNSEIIVGEDVHPNSRLLIKCNATFPVQFVYIGSGRPEFTTFTNVQWREDPQAPLTFEAEVSLGLLGFQGALREEDTGNYTCRSIQNGTILSYYYVYVPGPSLFTPPDGYNTEVYYTPKDKNVLIPCAVAHPRAVVSLHKAANGKLQCPSLGSNLAPYNPKKGFLLNLKDQKNVNGTYLCIASKDNSFRMMEYQLINTEGVLPGGKGPCNPNPCGISAECSIMDGSPVCYCFRGLAGNPYSECIMNKDRCSMTKDCPKGQFCVQGKCSKNPCDPNPCGFGSTCLAYGGRPRCSCKTGYDGKPPYCIRKCVSDSDCPQSNEACFKNYCQKLCPGPCGINAECQVVTSGYDSRVANCTCPQGTFGNPLDRCLSPDEPDDGKPASKCPPGYVGPGPPKCIKAECNVDRDCGSKEFCEDSLCVPMPLLPPITCPKNACGVNAICEVYKDAPVCMCPPRTTGDPKIRCTPIRNSNNGTDACVVNNPCERGSTCQVNYRGEPECISTGPSECPRGYRGLPPNCVPEPKKCFEDEDCPSDEECAGGLCIDSCGGPCGANAICIKSKCECVENFRGDPYTICRKDDRPRSPCNPSPCAQFAECRVVNEQPACRCWLGYQGDAFSECYPVGSGSESGYPKRPFQPGYVDEDDYRPSYPKGYPTSQRPLLASSQIPEFERDIPIRPPSRERPQSSRGNYPGGDSSRPLRPISPPYGREPPQQSNPSGFERDIPIRPPSSRERPQSSREGYPGSGPSRLPPPISDPPDFGREIPIRPPSSRERPQPSRDNPFRQPPPLSSPPEFERDIPIRPSSSNNPYATGPARPPYNAGETLPPQSLRPSFPFRPPYPSRLPPSSPPPQSSRLPPLPSREPRPPPPPLDDPSRISSDGECDIRRFGECGPLHRCQRGYDGIPRCQCVSETCQGGRISGQVDLTRRNNNPRSATPSGLCQSSNDCFESYICINSTCMDSDPCSIDLSPCISVAHSECRVIEGHPLCTCQRGYVGSPANGLDCQPDLQPPRRTQPQLYTKRDTPPLTPPSNTTNVGNFVATVSCDFKRGIGCDTRSECRRVDDKGVCVCGAGYTGNYPDCHLKCLNDLDCGELEECVEHQCVNPCDNKSACGANAFCRVVDHTVKCECHAGFNGNPWVGCAQKSHVKPRGLPMKCNGLRCTFF